MWDNVLPPWLWHFTKSVETVTRMPNELNPPLSHSPLLFTFSLLSPSIFPYLFHSPPSLSPSLPFISLSLSQIGCFHPSLHLSFSRSLSPPPFYFLSPLSLPFPTSYILLSLSLHLSPLHFTFSLPPSSSTSSLSLSLSYNWHKQKHPAWPHRPLPPVALATGRWDATAEGGGTKRLTGRRSHQSECVNPGTLQWLMYI